MHGDTVLKWWLPFLIRKILGGLLASDAIFYAVAAFG